MVKKDTNNNIHISYNEKKFKIVTLHIIYEVLKLYITTPTSTTELLRRHSDIDNTTSLDVTLNYYHIIVLVKGYRP